MSITSRVLRSIISEGIESDADVSKMRYYLFSIEDLSNFLDSPVLKPASRLSSEKPKQTALPKKYYEVVLNGDVYTFNDKGFKAVDDTLYTHEVNNPINVRKYITNVNADLGVYNEEEKQEFEDLREQFSNSLNIKFKLI